MLGAAIAHAGGLPNVPLLHAPLNRLDCKTPTPILEAAPETYPEYENIYHTNKPAIPPGKSLYAKGEILTLMGRVYDENCLPLQGAHIEMWQTDTAGNYKAASKGEWVSPDPTFAGSGRAVTNNMGEYQFVTIFPGPYDKRAPHINLKISHPDFETIYTSVYFEGDRRNVIDEELDKIDAAKREYVMAKVRLPQAGDSHLALQAFFDIILKGEYTKIRFKP